MYTSSSQRLLQLLHRTRGALLLVVVYAAAVVLLYRHTDGQWISLPWSLPAVLGVTLAVSTAFKASHRYARAESAESTWSAVDASSRNWGLLVHALLRDNDAARRLVQRHLAWLAALRQPRARNNEVLARALRQHLGQRDADKVLAAENIPEQVLRLQSMALQSLLAGGKLDHASFLELHRLLQELQQLQCRTERPGEDIAESRHATVDSLLLGIFGLLLPFGLLDAMGPLILFDDTVIAAVACWIIVPLATLLQGSYLALDTLGRPDSRYPNPLERAYHDARLQGIEQELRAGPGSSGAVGIPVASTMRPHRGAGAYAAWWAPTYVPLEEHLRPGFRVRSHRLPQ